MFYKLVCMLLDLGVSLYIIGCFFVCVCVCVCVCVRVRVRVRVCVCVCVVFIMYFNLTQTALLMEGGGGTHWTDGLILLHCDVEVREDTHHHCCSHLHLGSGV
jgi:hypothetical protein